MRVGVQHHLKGTILATPDLKFLNVESMAAQCLECSHVDFGKAAFSCETQLHGSRALRFALNPIRQTSAAALPSSPISTPHILPHAS